MYLSKLEIVGFKSFADKITLSFQEGLCAIVGPNGVGKTNFVDAIRWVLGEQKTSVLRSENMENVIFNGSKNRKQLGMAEVSITIINNKKILPSEFDEINIARRLYRDGDSQYLINKQTARLKDIQNLFMDSGLGADSYSVIELKMIENLLNGNVANRREIFEEAAGIKKFKQNKKEATKKLQVVSLDIDRINDILQEVQKNVNSLSRQAAKTKRYNTLINELRQLELNFLSFEFLSHKSKVYEIEQQSHKLKDEIARLENEIVEIEKYQSEIKSNFKKTDEQYQSLIRNEIEQNAKLSDANNSIRINEEKVINIESLQASLTKEIQDYESYIENSLKNLENLRIDYATHLNNQTIYEDKLKIEKEKEIQIKQKFDNVQNLLNSKISLKNERNNRKNYLLSIIQKNKANLERNIRRIQEETYKFEKYKQQIVDLEQLIENYKMQKIELSEKQQSLKSKLKELNNAKYQSEKLIEISRDEELELRKQLNEKYVEKKFLESIVVSDEAVKSLISATDWLEGKERIMLGEIITIDEKYKRAVLVSLEEAISALMVSEIDDIKSGIRLLSDKKKGLANFLINKQNKENLLNIDLPKQDGVLGFISEFIEIKEEYQNYLKQITNNIILVENVDVAWKLINDGLNFRIVTIDGVLFNENGIVRGGGDSSSQKGALIGRRNKINKLAKEIDELEQKISNLQTLIKEEQSKIWKYAIPDVENEFRLIEKQINSVDNSINSEINRIEINKNSLQNSNSHLNQLRTENEEMNNEKSVYSDEISAIDEEIKELDIKINQIQSEYTELKNLLDEQIRIIRVNEIDFAKNTETIKYITSEIEKVSAMTENAKERMKEKQNEMDNNAKSKQLLQTQIIELIELRNQIEARLGNILHNKQVIEINRKQLQEQIAQYDITLEQYRKNYNKLQNEFYSLEVETAGLYSRIDSLQQQAQEQYQIDLNEYILANQLSNEQLKDYDSARTKTLISEIKEKIAGLGNVNFQALEDFEEQKQRLEFLLTQMNDLQSSKKTLSDTIDEINKIAVEKFTKTFEDIRSNFRHLFKILFGENGEADLSLEGENALEAGIYISAKPPFKKPSSIDLLSAGEKTLTAIALLFAIYLVKPSPFCILDEVDAPLDDNNIDKFVYLLKKFSTEKDIQFILITHNKRTMESADALYGLTMEEEGVTKIVSVKLEK